MLDADTFLHKNQTSKRDQFPKRLAISIVLNRLGTFPTYPQTNSAPVSIFLFARRGKKNINNHCIFHNMILNCFRSFQICTCDALKCHQHIKNGYTCQAFYPGMARIKAMTCIAEGL
ncbi:UNVERIFIED_CONTAM: hypothetical protein NCL1_55296 [Trichonephila clavipes]